MSEQPEVLAPAEPKILSEIPTSGGTYEIVKINDTQYEIHRDGKSIHGICSADNVIAWFFNALFNAEYLLMKRQKSG